MQYVFNERREFISSIEFKNTNPILNIDAIRAFKEEGVVGKFTKKEFRYSYDNFNWYPSNTTWYTLNTANLQNIPFNDQNHFYLHTKYTRGSVIEGNIKAFYLLYTSKIQTDPNPLDASIIDADLLQGEDGYYYLNLYNHYGGLNVDSFRVENVGSGAQILRDINYDPSITLVYLRSIVGTGATQISQIGNEIIIDVDTSLGSDYGRNVGTGDVSIYVGKELLDLTFRTIKSGEGITVSYENFSTIKIATDGKFLKETSLGSDFVWKDSSLGIAPIQRIPVNDVDYTVSGINNQLIAYTNVTQKRYIYLPPATTLGQIIRVFDENGKVTPTNRLYIQCYGSDMIDDRSYNMQISRYNDIWYTSNGLGRWTMTNRNQRLSNGIVLQPSFTDLSTGIVMIGDGLYNLQRDPSGNGLIRTFEIDGSTLTLTPYSTNYVIADYNNGNPIIRATTNVEVINETTIIPLFTIYMNGNNRLHYLNWEELGLSLVNKIHQSIVKTQRYRRQNGLVLGEQSVRKVTLTEGIVWVGANKYDLPAFNSSTNELFFLYRSGGIWQDPSIHTQYNNQQYDDGDLHDLSGSHYSVNFIYRGIENENECYMVLGAGNYSLLEAQGSLQPANLPPIITSHAMLVGRIIVQHGIDTAAQIDSMFVEAYQLQSAIDHENLSNLLGGDIAGHWHLTENQHNNILLDSSLGVNFIWDASGYLDVSVAGSSGPSGPSVDGGVWITNITPTSTGNVGTKVYSSDGVVLDSCVTDTSALTIAVRALPGHTNYKPMVYIDASLVTLAASSDAPVFTGTKTIIFDPLDTSVTVHHEDGASWSTVVNQDIPPVILSATFTHGYPGSQTQLKSGDTFDLSITADMPIDQVVVDNYGALQAGTFSVSGTTVSITGVIADRGTSIQLLGFSLHVRKSTGAISTTYISTTHGSVDGIDVVYLCNLYPTVTFGTVLYPGTQGAIRSGQDASVNNTVSNYDTINYTSPSGELTIANATTYETIKKATYLSGTYNISSNNIRIVAVRTANAASTTSNSIVWIANTPATLSVSNPASRLRSGGSNGTAVQDHTITITSSQRLLAAPTLAKDTGGTWQGGGFTWSAGATSFTRSLRVVDAESKGTFNWGAISGTNLAGQVTTTNSGSTQYILGGFVVRTITVAAFGWQADISVGVSDYTKLSSSGSGQTLSWSVKDLTTRSTLGDVTRPQAAVWSASATGTIPTTINILDKAATDSASQASTFTIQEAI